MNSPLSERDFAEIRANVLREIARRQRRNAFVLAASVAFAAIAIVFVLMPRAEKRGGEAASAPLRNAPARVAARPSLHGAEAAPPPLVATTHHPKRHHRHHHPIAIASSETSPMTIELHTANPDVRIIWIAK